MEVTEVVRETARAAAESAPPMAMTVDLLLGARTDPAAWAARNTRGEVPDRLPYGLDRLSEHGLDVVPPRTSGSRSTAGRALRAAGRAAGGRFDWGVVSAWRPRGDVVLSWSEQAGVPVALVHGHRTPVVTGVIWATDAAPPPRHVRRLVLEGLRRAAGVVVLSSAQATPLVDRLGLAPRKVHVIPFGIDADFFAPQGAAVDPDLIVSVGNDRHRDWPTVFTAFAAVRRCRPATRLVIVSSTVPPELQEVLTPADGITVVPQLDHGPLRDLVSTAAACLVLTSRNLHASGITAALEAQAVGRPVVVSDQPGMRDYAVEGSSMQLTAPGDSEGVARRLLDLLSDASAADEIGAAGRACVIAHFTTHRQAGALARVLLEASP